MKTRMMTEKLHDWQDQMSQTARDVGRKTDDYVHENTWTTVAFAAVLGCVVGYLLGHHRD